MNEDGRRVEVPMTAHKAKRKGGMTHSLRTGTDWIAFAATGGIVLLVLVNTAAYFLADDFATTLQNTHGLLQVIAILIGAMWIVTRWNAESKWQREKLTWELADDLHNDPDALPALLLLDEESDTVPARESDGKPHPVSAEDIEEALKYRPAGKFNNEPKYRAIRAPFDALLYNYERLAHAIDLELIDENDVFPPTKYYAGKMVDCERHEVYEVYRRYAEHIGYKQAVELIGRLGKAYHGERGKPSPTIQ